MDAQVMGPTVGCVITPEVTRPPVPSFSYPSSPRDFLPQITFLDRLSGIHSGHGNGSLVLDPHVVLVAAADGGIGWCTTVLVGVVGGLVIIVATFGCKPTDLLCIPSNPAITSHLRRGCDGP